MEAIRSDIRDTPLYREVMSPEAVASRRREERTPCAGTWPGPWCTEHGCHVSSEADVDCPAKVLRRAGDAAHERARRLDAGKRSMAGAPA